MLRPHLGDAAADTLIARERRDVFSIYPEVRIAGWAGAMLLATAAGIVLKNNLDRIGPLALALLIGLASAACYAWVWWRRTRATAIDDYVLLLGALLFSADVAFVESQFHLLDAAWPRHFLLVAIVHGAGAYVFGSRLLLSLSLTAFAAWLGVEQQRLDKLFAGGATFATRALVCAALVVAWRAIDRRLNRKHDFARVFEHFAANLALLGGLALVFDDPTRVAGALLTIALAAPIIAWGFRVRGESFVLYAFVYGVIAVDALFVTIVDEEALRLLFVLVSAIGAIVGLVVLHAKYKERAV